MAETTSEALAPWRCGEVRLRREKSELASTAKGRTSAEELRISHSSSLAVHELVIHSSIIMHKLQLGFFAAFITAIPNSHVWPSIAEKPLHAPPLNSHHRQS